MKTGIANLPLHYGKAPRWLFDRMTKLSGEISEIIIDEYGADEFLRRLANPFWFQAFGCVLGFDWHSSGLTTTVLGALKVSLNEKNLGIQVCGGKGATSRKTPMEIENTEFNLSTKKIEELKRASKLSAKVDNSLIQDGFQLYHHNFIFTEKGKWAVVQQGMSDSWARRYHWLSENVNTFVEEPHSAIVCDLKKEKVLNLTAKESKETRKATLDLVKSKNILTLPKRHGILKKDLTPRAMKIIKLAYELQPRDYEELISIKGVGPKTIRSLTLISDLIYGTKASWKDPVKYSFAHGGKDGIPFPVDKPIYDKSIEILRDAIENAKIGKKEKILAIKRLSEFAKV
ncbi:MAG: DUF763 domain-containing protein [Nanoarchaeota archaeon]|nr:DUF763 domain-containing protein [Nanoarchaeota archaeon]